MFDELKDQALNLAKEHKDVVADAAGQAAGKVGDQIDAATQGASEKVSGFLEQE